MPLWNSLWNVAVGPQSCPKLPETAAMCEDVLLTSKGPFGCCYSGCSLHMAPRNDGFNDVLALAICTWGQGVNFEIGQSGRRAEKQRSHLGALWGIYLERKVNQKHRRSFSWQLRQWQRDLSRNAKRNCFRVRLILTHESYSGGNKRLTLQVCIWQMLLKILSWKRTGKNPGFIVLKPQWHRSTFIEKKKKVLIICFY